MKITHKFLLGLLIAIMTTVLLTGCNSETKSASGKSQEDGEPIKVNVAINGGIGPIVIAKEKGWLEEEFKSLNAEVAWSEFRVDPHFLNH